MLGQFRREVLTCTPRRPRWTSPLATSCFITLAMLIGTAKPTPTLPPPGVKMAVLMPMSSPLQVDERAAGIARIDRGVRLNEVLVASRPRPVRPRALTIPEVTALAESEGIADGEHVVADFETIGIAERQRRQVFGRNLQHRDVGVGIAAHERGVKLPIVLQRHDDPVGMLDDVMICQDVAGLRVDDDARSGDLRLIALLAHDGDIDDRRGHGLQKRRQISAPGRRPR